MERDEIEGIAKLKSPEKEKRRHKHKSDEVKEEIVVDAVSKEEENLKSPEKGSPKKKEKRRHKHKPDGAQAVLKEEEESSSKSKAPAEGGKKRKRKKKIKKLVTVKLSDELMEYLRTKEVMGYLARETPRPLPFNPRIAQDMFSQELRQEIAAQVHENREFDAFVLYQYRTKGYAEIQQEVSDDDEEV